MLADIILALVTEPPLYRNLATTPPPFFFYFEDENHQEKKETDQNHQPLRGFASLKICSLCDLTPCVCSGIFKNPEFHVLHTNIYKHLIYKKLKRKKWNTFILKWECTFETKPPRFSNGKSKVGQFERSCFT